MVEETKKRKTKHKRVLSEAAQKAYEERKFIKSMFSMASRAHDKYGNPIVWN